MEPIRTPQYRLCADDRERYPGPEWLVYDTDALLECDLDTLEQIEETIGWSLIELGVQLSRGTARSLRAMIWISRRMAGCDDAWASFKPKVWKIEHREPVVEAVDVDPPANRASRRAAAKAPAKSASRSRVRASAT